MLQIGILTSNPRDSFVHKLGQWILFYGHKPVIIYESDIIQNESLEIDINSDKIGVELTTNNGMEINFDTVSLFYRRGWHHSIPFPKNENDFYRDKELFAVRNLILDKIEKKNKLVGKCSTTSLQKMKHLQEAKRAGLTIPNSLIVTSTSGLSSKLNYITKGIDAIYLKQTKGSTLTNYTKEVSKLDIEDDFYPALFQVKIDKKLELRAFIFLKTFYCVAYISKGINSDVDNRVMIAENKVESYPFLLPEVIRNKILNMMSKLDVEVGSIEFIVTNADEYIFLDFNPFGQIGMTSFDTFPHIEQEIAKTLIKHAEEKN